MLLRTFDLPAQEFPERAVFRNQLERSFASARRGKRYSFAVLFLAVDRFPLILQTLGTDLSDRLLSEIGKKLRLCLRDQDLIAWWDSGQYAILLHDVRHPADILRCERRIRNALSGSFEIGGQEVSCTGSIGAALGSESCSQPEVLLQEAKTALDRAQKCGVGEFELFDRSTQERAMEVLRLEMDLRRALEREEFRLHYQPIVSLQTKRIVGFEALMRWQHPKRGLLSPAEFIPIAEETGLLLSLSEWVLREACSQLGRWRSRGLVRTALPVSINLTSKQVTRPELASEVRSLLISTGLEPKDLCLEITESQLMDNSDSASRTLSSLHDLGIKLAIDDFGTGFSSLSHLANLRVQTLKVDRSFVSNLNGEPRHSAILRAIISLGFNLGLEIIAEGVETEEQANFMRALECPFAQGFYFARPLEPQFATRLLGMLGE